MKGILGLVIVVAVLGAIAWFYSPALRSKASEMYVERVGWTDEARRSDPVGYFDYAIERLKEDAKKLEDVRGKLNEAQARLEQVRLENREKIQQVGLQAEGLKAKYLEAKEKSAFPIVYVDRPYYEQDVMDQIKIWLGQRKAYETIVAQAEKALEAQKNKRQEMVMRITDTNAKIPMLQSQKTIVQMDKLTAETEAMMANVNDVLVMNEAQLQKNPVRTIEEIMADSAKGAGDGKTVIADQEVAEFLGGASRPADR
jgi:16S rRNA G966 N2-methylase RsmD